MLTELAIKRPVLTAMASVVLLVLGIMSFMRLGIEMFPDVSMPFVTILTVYPGASPADVEEEVTNVLEDACAGVNGVKSVFSRSSENASLVWLEFTMETSVDTAVQEVRERVEGVVRNMPDGAERPMVSRFDIRSFPILVYSVSAGDDAERARVIAEDTFKPTLEQIPGVALVRVTGGRTREIQVRLDPERLEAHGLAPGLVYQRLRQENLAIPSGNFESGPSEIGVRVDGRFSTVEDIEDIVLNGGTEEQLRSLGRTVSALARGGQSGVASLPALDDAPIRVRDVAEVIETHREERTIVRLDGEEAVILEIIKQSSGNTVAVAEAVLEELAELQAQHPDIQVRQIRDEADPIISNAHDVERALIVGGLMAVLIILVFLVDWRGTLISAMALPVSVIGTFAAMHALGFSLNMITLLGLSLAIGLLIDDSVVVREAITRRLEMGDDPFTAARTGTAEIRLAVIATTLTVCAVFVPVAFMSGLVGQFFKEFGLTVAAAVLISTFVALSLDPMLSARLVKVRKESDSEREWVVARGLKRGLRALDTAYHHILGWALRHPMITISLGLSAFAGGVALIPVLGSEFVPVSDRGRFIVNMRFPPGASLAEAGRRALVFEREVLDVEDVIGIQCVVGDNNDARRVRCNVLCTQKTERTRTMQDIKDDVRVLLARVPQAVFAISNVPQLEGLGGDYPPIMVQVRGPDLEQLRVHAERIAQEINEVEGTSDVDLRFSPGLPELAVRVDRDRARHRGLTVYDVALQTRLALHGDVASTIRRGRRNIDIRVMLNEAFRRDPDALADLQVWGPGGAVSLGEVSMIEARTGPVDIGHEDRQRQIAVWSQVVDRPLGDVVRDVRARLDPIDWGDGYNLKYAGFQEDMRETNEAFVMAFVLALVFIFIILASQFESLVHPFTIVVSLPLGFIGALLALLAWGRPLSLPASLGVILLIGLCAKNGILLVDGALTRMRDKGLAPAEAMLRAGPRRLRPILMTSAAMIFGMLPTAVARESGSEFRFPMAVAVIGGVISNTLLTLLVLPVVFVLFERIAGFWRRLLLRK